MNIQKTILIDESKDYIIEPLLSNYVEVEEKGNKYIVGYYHDKKIYVDVLFLNGRDVSHLSSKDRCFLLDNWIIKEVYPTVLRWVVSGKNVLKFLNGQRDYEEFIIREGENNIVSSINRDYVTCKGCGYTFNHLSIPESGMGWVICPGCGRGVDQEGNASK
jgi:hypothetical protein